MERGWLKGSLQCRAGLYPSPSLDWHLEEFQGSWKRRLTLAVLEVLVKSKPQPLVASKAFPQEILDVGAWKVRGEMGGIWNLRNSLRWVLKKINFIFEHDFWVRDYTSIHVFAFECFIWRRWRRLLIWWFFFLHKM